MKINLNAVLDMPCTVNEILDQIKEVTGKETTKKQIEEKLLKGLMEILEQETDDEMTVETATCNITEDNDSHV